MKQNSTTKSWYLLQIPLVDIGFYPPHSVIGFEEESLECQAKNNAGVVPAAETAMLRM